MTLLHTHRRFGEVSVMRYPVPCPSVLLRPPKPSPATPSPRRPPPPDRARAAGSTRRMERTEEVSGNVGCQKHHPGACVKRCETTQRSAVTDPRSEKTSRRTGPKASWRRPNQKHIKGVLAHQTAETGRLGQHTFAKRALI